MTVTAVPGKLGELAGKPRLIHEDVIDFLLANPGASNKDLAKQFGMSYQWCLILTNSDGFQRRYEERRKEMVDPALKVMLEDRMKGLVAQSIEVLMEKLQVDPKTETALKALDIGSKALGYGAKPQVQVNQHNQSFVVQVPQKSRNSVEWLEDHGPGGLPPTHQEIFPAGLPAPNTVPGGVATTNTVRMVEDAREVGPGGFAGDNPPGNDDWLGPALADPPGR